MEKRRRDVCWESSIPSLDLELQLGGTDTGPHEWALEMATLIEKDFDSVVEAAATYVRQHVGSEQGLSGALETQWVEVGLDNPGSPEQFELFASDDNTYTLWSVVFQYAERDRSLAAIGFSRRKW